jgi:hypothetical protein
MRHRTTLLALATAVSGTLAGCGFQHPIETPRTSPGLGALLGHNELGHRPDPADQRPAAGPSHSPQDAIERFGTLYINWTYRSLPSVQRRLAALAIGEARAAEAEASAKTAHDDTLRIGRVANRGTILSIAPMRGARAGRFVVVTSERSSGASSAYVGLSARPHVIYASAQQVYGGWAVSRWQPQD